MREGGVVGLGQCFVQRTIQALMMFLFTLLQGRARAQVSHSQLHPIHLLSFPASDQTVSVLYGACLLDIGFPFFL